VMMALKGTRITTYGVPMLSDGCYDTQVDYNDIIRAFEEFS